MNAPPCSFAPALSAPDKASVVAVESGAPQVWQVAAESGLAELQSKQSMGNRVGGARFWEVAAPVKSGLQYPKDYTQIRESDLCNTPR